MLSKQVRDNLKSSLAVQATEAYIDPCVAALTERLGATAGGAARTLLRASLDKLKEDTDRMSDADMAHASELADDGRLRDEREAAVDTTYSLLTDLRTAMSAIFGAGAAAQVGFARGETPRDPTALLGTAERVAMLLPAFEGKPLQLGVTFDPGVYVKPLTKACGTLRQSLDTLAMEARQAEATLVRRHEAVDQYEVTFRATAALMSALLAAAGMPELAARVRPSARRPGRTVEEAERRDPPA